MTVRRETAEFGSEMSSSGAFTRQRNWFTDRITRDGSSGYTAEAGRYHLYVSLACPWAHRSVIVRELLGLQQAITMSVVDPIRDEKGWRFTEGEGHGPDPVNGYAYLSQAYAASDPEFRGRVTVPCIWDRQRSRIVTNDFPEITTQFHTELRHLGTNPGVDLYPEARRAEIDSINEMVYRDVNNGVYQAGFATDQASYEVAFDALFAALGQLDRRLSTQRFLIGDTLTEADIRLFTTLVRFDAVYHGHFKCNLRRLVDYEHLWPYARDLYQRPGFGDTVDFDHIKRHYYATHLRINPTGIVPGGPEVDWHAPHGRG